MIRRAAIILGLASLVGCGHSKDVHPVAAWNSSLESELTHSFENKKFVLGHTFNIGPRLNDFSANLADLAPSMLSSLPMQMGNNMRLQQVERPCLSVRRSKLKGLYRPQHRCGLEHSVLKMTLPMASFV